MAQNHPDHPGMGHKQRRAGFFKASGQKRDSPALDIVKTFSVRRSECVQMFPPLFEPFRIPAFNFIKRPPFPLSQIDFIQCRVADDLPVPGNPSGRIPASGKAAGVDGIDFQGRQGMEPIRGLGSAGVIQIHVRDAYEPPGAGTDDLPVPKQKKQAVSLQVFL
jgi:hypothetical protein